MINGPMQEIYILISLASSEGSGESGYMRRLSLRIYPDSPQQTHQNLSYSSTRNIDLNEAHTIFKTSSLAVYICMGIY